MTSSNRGALRTPMQSFSVIRGSLPKTPLLITPRELHETLRSSSDVSILDASWLMPNSPRIAKEEFMSKRIPGARYFDLDQVASPSELGLKHMMPSRPIFSEAMEKLGIKPSDHVIIYDSQGIFSSPRALFTFKAFGHHRASVLDGGLPRWEAEGLSTESGPPDDVRKTSYPALAPDESIIKSYTQVVNNSEIELSKDPTAELVLDARARGRYLGTDPEPRPGLPSGHIPHSFSIPFNAFLRTNTVPNSTTMYTTFLPPAELRQKLVESVGEDNTQAIIRGERKVITSCGSGMTAGVLWLGLKLIAESSRVAIYDESWTGYASRKGSKIDKSEA
ncbi:hypothetical protein EW146_g38 [Bondarzewia mesenterica]|uniref:Rhodanese domain-containing protein n=1 Tax=Bondarzewia mesenterica TaxID=1095465 RepID=A0A4S4M887_9AGAM|nr:hypothetical protein EW146_g38 [Bondarzewia mesenterica]